MCILYASNFWIFLWLQVAKKNLEILFNDLRQVRGRPNYVTVILAISYLPLPV